jgi:putative nucleotidyltransferase with HDIG domain
VSSLVIVWLQPRKNVSGHEVDAFDAVWPYQDLVLENDFFIKKSDRELKNEYAQIEKDAPLFFEVRESDHDQKMKNLELLKSTSSSAFKLLKGIFDSIYNRGVIETLSPEQSKKAVFISNGSFAEQSFYYNFYTIQSALNFIERNINDAIDKDPKLKEELEQIDPVDYLAVTHFLNKEKTDHYLQGRLAAVSLYQTIVRANETLVKRSEPLTNYKRSVVNAYLRSSQTGKERQLIGFLAGWLLFFILQMILLFYLAFFRKNIFGQNKQVFFLFSVVTASVLATSVFFKFGLSIFSLPFCLTPILVRVFFDSRTALFTHLITVLACSFFMADKLEFILLQLISGIGTLFAVAEMRKRQQVLNSALVIFILYCIVFASYHLFYGTQTLAWKLSAYVPFAIGSVLVLLAYPLIYLTEKIFGFISDFKLLELCDLNQPLLRQLSQDVPGTFQHSLQVANLAEEVIYYIGGNTLLVRTGAMYHDIGKLHNPKYFTENQLNGFSPHIEMQPQESAKIIIDHVIKGIELAKKHGLPEQIIDFIRTHHGTTTVGYFLHLVKKEKNITEAEEARFKYPGPIPFSKETAVLMMADGVEAASRSLEKHDALTINDLVDQIIDYKISQNQFINSDITFRDITLIKKVFKKRLMNMYHVRIEYPA